MAVINTVDDEKKRCIFPLTSLQIGDLQSYLSDLRLFLPSESGKFYVLVDNRPWLQDLVSMSTHWWQLMVTKSRLSPFANTRAKKTEASNDSDSSLDEPEPEPELESESRSFGDWFSYSLTEAMTISRKRALLPVKKLRNSLIANSKLHRTLYGFIVFEISWNDVRGVNYFSELQTDTSFAIEAKVMRRWEFDSVAHASWTISSWFPGTLQEQILLKEHLDSTAEEVYHDSHETFPMFSDIYSSPSCKRKVMKPIYFDVDIGICSGEADKGPVEVLLQTSHEDNIEETVEPSLYRDVLIILRFKDRDLPFVLKDVIMSRLRLLTLLEAGLPSWVIFLQSYPGFCRLYRPWMCPLARAVYVLISVVTVLIGFYDLYKNVPLLKTAVSNMFGPLFDWVEEWEMISRIRYLGTMLFLHNFQKAVKVFLRFTSFVSLFLRPLAEPFFELLELFFPFWIIFVRLVDGLFSIIWMVVEFSFNLVGDLLEILLLPLWYLLVLSWNVASSFIYPVLWVLLYAPFKLILVLYNLVSFVGMSIYDLFDDLWISARSISHITKEVNMTVSSVEVSMWRTLWKDLFSQLFKALRSILNGLVAFFAACNRHRLSIYNHVVEFTRRLQATRNARSNENIQIGQTHDKCKSSHQQHMKTM